MEPDATARLAELRSEIDRLDEQIVELLNSRAQISQQVGQVKGPDAAIFVPAREAELLARVRGLNQGPLRAQDLESVYREIISSSRRLQRPLRIAYLGPAATFSHQAALERFGQANEFIPIVTISDIFGEVERGAADYGIVPVENSTGGPVYEALDRLAEVDLKVCAEITLSIAQCLMARCSLDEIEVVYSHPQGLAQTRRWLTEHLPGREIKEWTSTAGAAELAARERNAAAVAPRLAAEAYGLEVLAENIQDVANNFTRFYVIGPAISDRPTGHDRTLLVFSIRDRVGALRDIVTVFSDAGINLSAIQSRPSRRKPWDYLFFVELKGHIEEPPVRQAVSEAEQHCVTLNVLGAWPTAE